MEDPDSVRIYIETNFLIGFARGQDPEAAALLDLCRTRARLVIPSVCFMETFSVIEGEQRRVDRLARDLRVEIQAARRDRVWESTRVRVESLERAEQQTLAGHDEFEERVVDAMGTVSRIAEMIPLDPEIVGSACQSSLTPDPADNLILHSILAHAREFPDQASSFLSGNTKHFARNPFASEPIRAANLKFFDRSSELLRWAGSTGGA